MSSDPRVGSGSRWTRTVWDAEASGSRTVRRPGARPVVGPTGCVPGYGSWSDVFRTTLRIR